MIERLSVTVHTMNQTTSSFFIFLLKKLQQNKVRKRTRFRKQEQIYANNDTIMLIRHFEPRTKTLVLISQENHPATICEI